MTEFFFTKQSNKAFLHLEKKDQERIIMKLKLLLNYDNITSAITPLTDFKFATHRLRIGSYRIILKLEKQDKNNYKFIIIDVGHRKDIYR